MGFFRKILDKLGIGNEASAKPRPAASAGAVERRLKHRHNPSLWSMSSLSSSSVRRRIHRS